MAQQASAFSVAQQVSVLPLVCGQVACVLLAVVEHALTVKATARTVRMYFIRWFRVMWVWIIPHYFAGR